MDERDFYKKILQENVVDKEQLFREIKSQKKTAKIISFRKVSALVATFVVLIGVVAVSYSFNFSNAFTKDVDTSTTLSAQTPRMVAFNAHIENYFSMAENIFVGEILSCADGKSEVSVEKLLKGNFNGETITLNTNLKNTSTKVLVLINELNNNLSTDNYNIFIFDETNNSFWEYQNPDEIFYLSDFLN